MHILKGLSYKTIINRITTFCVATLFALLCLPFMILICFGAAAFMVYFISTENIILPAREEKDDINYEDLSSDTYLKTDFTV